MRLFTAILNLRGKDNEDVDEQIDKIRQFNAALLP